jgi:hypothetical protein
MIARMWHGKTKASDAAAYLEYLFKSGIPAYRATMRQFGKETLDVIEAQEEVKGLLADYEESMRVYGIDIEHGLLESIVVPTAEIAEKVIKLEWSTLAKGLFKIDSDKVALMKVETEVPGREPTAAPCSGPPRCRQRPAP